MRDHRVPLIGDEGTQNPELPKTPNSFSHGVAVRRFTTSEVAERFELPRQLLGEPRLC